MLLACIGLLMTMMVIKHEEGFIIATGFTFVALFYYWIDARYS